MQNFSTVYWKKKEIAAPFLIKRINVKLWHASIVQNESVPLQNGNISIHLPTHHFCLMEPGRGVGSIVMIMLHWGQISLGPLNHEFYSHSWQKINRWLPLSVITGVGQHSSHWPSRETHWLSLLSHQENQTSLVVFFSTVLAVSRKCI